MPYPIHPTIDTLETEHYAIMPDFSYNKVAHLELAFKFPQLPIFAVKKENIGSTKSKFDDGYFAHSKYSFFDKNLISFIYTNNGWTLLDIREPSDRSRTAFYKISDPKSVIREISNHALNPHDWGEYFHIQGICNIIRLITELSDFDQWAFFDILIEKKRLQKENETLKSKIIDLEMRLKEIKDGN